MMQTKGEAYLETVKKIQFEISSNCNAECPGCVRFLPLNVGKDRNWLKKNVFLRLEVFKKLIDDAVNAGLDEAEFCGTIDDPVMHPEFLDMLEHCAKRKVTVRIHTNAGARKPEYWAEMARILVETKHSVSFSIDGLEDTNHLYRRKTDFNKIMANAKAFIDEGGRARWQYIIFPWNEHQVQEASNRAAELGFEFFKSRHDRSGASKLDPYDFDASVAKHLKVTRNGDWEKYVKTLDNKSKDDEIDCRTRSESMIFVAHTGEVWPCCFMHNGHYRSAGLMPEYRRRFLDHYEHGWNNLNKHDIATILDHEFYANDLVASWDNKDHGTGQWQRISRCTETCSKKELGVRPIGGGNIIEPDTKKNDEPVKQPVDSPTFCILPWIHVNASVAGKYRPCCNSDASFGKRDNIRSLHTAFHDTEMQELRRSMVAGEKHSACNVCWDKEKVGALSFRQTYTQDKFKEFVNPEDSQSLKYIDMRFDNQCNLGCRMCDPSSSNRVQDTVNWYHDNDKQLPDHWKIFTRQRSDSFIKQQAEKRKEYVMENLYQLRVFKVTGGEPFMSKDFNEVLDKAITDDEAKHIRLMITTNGTKFTHTILNKLEYFEGLDLNVSVDGTGEVYDYVRWPFNWDMWCQRFETLLQWVDDKKFYRKNFRLRTSTLISAYNWLDAPRLYEHLHDYTNKYPWLNDINYVPRIDFNLFLRPEDSELSPRWLPDHILDLGLQRWEKTDNRQVDEFRAFVNAHKGKQLEERQEKFVYMTTSLDEQREESYQKLDPELAQWIREFNGRK